MQASISYDRAADYYDETRGFPIEVGDEIAHSLGEWIDPGDPLLEIGTGTGRIALPLLSRGFNLTGLDISPRMLQKFVLKAQPVHPALIVGDAHTLPFPDGSFPTVLSVQLLHLVEDWQEVIQEARRVTAAHGVFILGYTVQTDENTPEYEVAMHMREELKVRGIQRRKDFLEAYNQVHQELLRLGASFEEKVAATWIVSKCLKDTLTYYEQQVFSHSWTIPDDQYFQAFEATRIWALEKYPDPDLVFEHPHKFGWQRYQW
jgi:ubiquinone/menaquinone biosynthesis C-methylase UbiE